MSTARWGRIGFALLAWLFLFMAVAQVYLAGSSVSDLGGSGDFELHRNFGYISGVVALALLVLSFAGRLPLRIIGPSALLLGLMVLQSVFIFVRTSSPNIAALHPLNGSLIGLVALWVAWRSLGYIRSPLPPEKPRPAPAPASPPPSPPDRADPDEDE